MKPIVLIFALLLSAAAQAQGVDWSPQGNESGGELLAEQAAYDVRSYSLDIAVDPEEQRIDGNVTVRADVVAATRRFVLDLDDRLQATEIRIDGKRASFEHEDDRLWIDPGRALQSGEAVEITVHYGGAPRIAPMPPWNGGFTWEKTANGEHWIGVTSFADGPDIWWPAKDHPSDEPEDGVTMRFTVPDDLTVVSNGRFEGRTDNGDGTATHRWRVTTSIDLYNVTFNAGPFVAITRDYTSVSGRPLPITFWALPEDLEEAQRQMPELESHLAFYEQVLGPYPFQGDKYGFVETPYIAMEHQTNLAHGKDAMATVRMGFHYVPLHELGHEWWGNLVSNDDYRHLWIQEGIDGYMEALYAEHRLGEAAYREYVARFLRPGVSDDRAVVAPHPITARAALREYDPYLKGAMVMHSLRWVLGDDLFFKVLRKQAYPSDDHSDLLACGQCRLTNSEEFVERTEAIAGRGLDWFFDLYLYDETLPRLDSKRQGGELVLHWDTPGDFPMPVEIRRNGRLERVAMPGGSARIDVGDDDIEIDPFYRVLRQAKPDPDDFGTLGAGDIVGLQSEQ